MLLLAAGAITFFANAQARKKQSKLFVSKGTQIQKTGL
jgi:hypothetical protein